MFVICPTTITVSGTTAVYVPVPKGCRVVGASYVVTTGVTVAADTLTISDGTTTAGTVSVAVGAAGSGASNFTPDTTSLGKVRFDGTTPIKITPGGASTAGAITLGLLLSEYHAA
jgi:hypothetical protein